VTHRKDIQGLRAVAVVLVALNHAGIPFLTGGYVGVDVFFVLSGFLITGILLSEAERNGHVSLTEFYARRARRILPAAVLTLVVTSIAAHHLLNFVRARSVVEDSIWASLFAANIHFRAPGQRLLRAGAAPVADPPFLDALDRGAVLSRLADRPLARAVRSAVRTAPPPSSSRGDAAESPACCRPRADRDRRRRNCIPALVDSLHAHVAD